MRPGGDPCRCGHKEGFLRSETSLIQTIGRAARNIDGRVILYADHLTGSMERAIAETNREAARSRRPTTSTTASRPRGIKSQIKDILASPYERDHVTVSAGVAEGAKGFLGHNSRTTTLRELEGRMRKAASDLEIEDSRAGSGTRSSA